MPFGGALSLGIGAGTSLLGGVFGGKAAKEAAKQQAAAQQKVIDFTKGQIDTGKAAIGDATTSGKADVAGGVEGANQTLTDAQQKQLALLLPYIQSGTASLSSLQDLAGENGPLNQKFSFNPSDLENDPGYKFTLQQGQDAIQRSAAANGGLFSSGTLKSLAGYTTGTANQYFNDAYNRAQNTFKTNQQTALNRIGTLQGLAGYGFGATGEGSRAIGSTASQIASTTLGGSEFGANLGLTGARAGADLGLEGSRIVGGALTNQGNAQAAGTVGSADSWLTALNQGSNSILGYIAKKYPTGAPTPFVPQGPELGMH